MGGLRSEQDDGELFRPEDAFRERLVDSFYDQSGVNLLSELNPPKCRSDFLLQINIQTDMGTYGAKIFGMTEAPVTVEDCTKGMVERVCQSHARVHIATADTLCRLMKLRRKGRQEGLYLSRRIRRVRGRT